MRNSILETFWYRWIWLEPKNLKFQKDNISNEEGSNVTELIVENFHFSIIMFFILEKYF